MMATGISSAGILTCLTGWQSSKTNENPIRHKWLGIFKVSNTSKDSNNDNMQSYNARCEVFEINEKVFKLRVIDFSDGDSYYSWIYCWVVYNPGIITPDCKNMEA